MSMQVQHIARPQPVSAPPIASCAQVAQTLVRSGQGFIPICSNGKVQGMVHGWNLVQAIAQGIDPFNNPIRSIMQINPTRILPTASLEEAAALMEEKQTRCLCVCDEEGRLVGTLTLDQMTIAAPELAMKVLQATAYELPASEIAPTPTPVLRSRKIGVPVAQ